MKVDFKGFKEEAITFECDSTVVKGGLVKMSANGKVTVCSDNGAFIGVALNVANGYCTVQLAGYVEIPITGTVAVGYKNLTASTVGKVKVNDTYGREYLVLYADTNKIGFII